MTEVKANVVEPSASADAVEHADFVEYKALIAADRNSSLFDLRRDVNRSGSSEEFETEDEGDDDTSPPLGDEAGESIAASVAAEMSDRAIGSGMEYPFTFDGELLQANTRVENHLYTFLLLLSLIGPKRLDGRDPTRIFEDVSACAAEGYFGGPHEDVLRYDFGFPRRIRSSNFVKAVDEMCQLLGEGTGSKTQPTSHNKKDAGLDIVVARRFPDQRAGQLIGFGQCASGKHWRNKLTDLQPSVFCKLWLAEPLAVDPGRLFFLPFCVKEDEWTPISTSAGVVFDRCRITLFAKNVVKPVRTEYRAWTSSALRILRK